MKRIIGYVMKKLQVMDRDSTKVVQLLEILSALCTCKGVPVKQNQCKKLAMAVFTQVEILFFTVIILELLQSMCKIQDANNRVIMINESTV